MKKPLDLLLVEDNPDDARLLVRELERGGYLVNLQRTETADEFRQALADRRWDAIISDYSLPQFSGELALRMAQESGRDLPFIFVSGTMGEDIAVSAMKAGAHDYVTKGSLTRLVPAIERELRDAIERRQHREAERQMRMSEQKYRHLFRYMGEAALLIAAESDRIIDANEQAEVLFGRTRDELLGMPSHRLYSDGADRPDPAAVGGGTDGTETVVQRPDGRTVFVHVGRSQMTLFERPFVLALFRDITADKRAEEALRTSEQRLATMFNLSPSAICVVRATDDRFVEANAAFLAGTGYAREEIIGHTPAELGLWTEPGEREAILREVQRTGVAIAFKLKGRRKSGEVGVGLSSMARITLRGEPHLLTLVQDISELERAEEARRESEQRFRQLADAIDDVFWLTDASKRQMIYVSPAYARIWGRPCEQLYAEPQSWLDAVHPDDVDRVRAAVPSQAQGAFELEYRIVRPDGAVRRINERAFPVRNAAGMVYRIAGVASDITSRRELEEQFRQSQKMEAIGQLAGGIAHDFNNLLTVIELQSAALAEAQHNDPETSAGIHQILEASRRAANLTRQLLTFSRRQTHAARDVDLGEVLGGVTKMLRRILGEDITLESRFAPGLRPVHADPGMMEQVLMNLAVNARDAMPRGGRLLIALEPVTLDASAAAARHSARVGSFVCLSVSDTGCGIPPQIRDRIFEPFFTTKEIGKGTGLGLATVFGIVEQHGGWIELESTVGAGTTFRVFLPALSEAAAESRPAPAMPDLRGGTETILLVEDEDSVRLLAAASLRQRGYRVIEAANAREAFERWSQAEGRVDLLLTDLIMPGGLSGKDLVDQVLQAGSRVRIVYASGHSTSVVGRQLDLRPGINFLEKPYSIADLATIVRNRLDSPVSPAS